MLSIGWGKQHSFVKAKKLREMDVDWLLRC